MKTGGASTEVFVLAGAIVSLAALAFVIAKGDKTAKVVDSIFGGFIGAIKAATGQGKNGFA